MNKFHGDIRRASLHGLCLSALAAGLALGGSTAAVAQTAPTGTTTRDRKSVV